MKHMKKTFIIIAILGSLVLSHAQSSFEANLDGLQEVPPNASPAFGLGDFSLSGTTFSVTTGSYQDLLDAAPGVNGPVVFSLTLDSPGTTTGTFSGSGTLTAGQIADLNSGNLYVNIHSTVFPGGEIRGQLEPVPEPATMALMGAGSLALLAMRRRKV
jgi:hypothetical protein